MADTKLRQLPTDEFGTPYVSDEDMAEVNGPAEGAPADFPGIVIPNPDHIKPVSSEAGPEPTDLSGGAKLQAIPNAKGSPTMKPLGNMQAPTPAPEVKTHVPPSNEQLLAKQIQVNKDAALKEGGVPGLTKLGAALLQEKELHKSNAAKAVMHAAAQPQIEASPDASKAVTPESPLPKATAAGRDTQVKGFGIGTEPTMSGHPTEEAPVVPPATSAPDVGLGSAMPAPKYTGMLAYGQEAPKQGEAIPTNKAQIDTDLGAVPKTPEELKAREHELNAEIVNATSQGDMVRAGSAKAALAELQRQNPYGSELNHPGILGKIEHGLAKAGNIAGNIVAPNQMALIPGSDLNLQAKEAQGEREVEAGTRENLETAQAEAQKAAAGAAARDAKTQAALLGKGWVLGKDAQGNPTLTRIPGFEDTPKDMQQQLAEATQAYFKAHPDGTDLMADPKVKQIMDAMQNIQPQKAETAQDDLKKKEAVVEKLDKAHLPTDPEHIDASLDQALKAGVITEDEHAAYKGYQATKGDQSTKITVNTAEQKNKDALKKAGTYYTYTDEDNTTHLVSGDKLPEGADATPIKNVEQFVSEARAGNTVQQSLTRLQKDVQDDPQIWDSAAARAIIATATEDINRASAGLLIAGTGGSIPLPSGLGHIIDTALENKALSKKDGEAVRQYIADYKAMKDKALVMQMELQGGKIGRAGAQGFMSITQQLPDGSTPDSKTAKRQLDNLQQTQDQLMGKYPDKYQDFTKERNNAPQGNVIDASQVRTLKTGEQVYPKNGQWYDLYTNQPLQPKATK